MDKNSTNKTSNFFKKEGFYVILFVCLCIVASVAVISSKNSRKTKNQPPVAQNSVDKQTASSKETSNSTDELNKEKMEINNAKQVNNSSSGNASISVPKSGKQSVQTSAKASLNFEKPVVGNLIQGYSDEPVEFKPESSAVLQSFRSVYGDYISCKVGQDVFAAESGVVDNIEDTRNGRTVTIKHNDGYKTVYSNLDQKVNVAKGDKVTQKQKIGTVGKTAVNCPSYEDLVNGFLYFQVLKDNNPMDPAKFVKYEKAK